MSVLAGLLVVGVLGACGSSGSSGSTSASTEAATGASTAPAAASTTSSDTVASGTECGQVPVQPAEDPDGIIPTLDQEVQDAFNGYPGTVRKSAWADYPGTPGPWKIGLSGLASNSAFTDNLYKGVEDAFDEAKAAGLVTGELQKSIMPDGATQTPAQQIAGFQAMVRKGVDGVIMLPLAGDAIAPAITKAGKENDVPTIIMGNTNPSDYAVTVNSPNIAAGTAKTLEIIGGKGNVLVVRGIPGVPAETYGYKQISDEIKACPDVKIIGEINGNWNNASSKTATLQFLASHPGKIDAVLQNGIMAQGIIQAFEQAGREVPPVTMVGAQAGELSYFADHVKDGYETAGSAYNGVQQADSAFRVLLRILAGNGPKVTDIPLRPALVTKDNVADFVPPGATLSTVDDPTGDPQDYAPDEYLDKVFTKPGNPEAGN